MSPTKPRTYPASVCPDIREPSRWNVRDQAGHVVFSTGVADWMAQQACRAINQSYDWGRDA